MFTTNSCIGHNKKWRKYINKKMKGGPGDRKRNEVARPPGHWHSVLPAALLA
jgi:hypothetical protein